MAKSQSGNPGFFLEEQRRRSPHLQRVLIVTGLSIVGMASIIASLKLIAERLPHSHPIAMGAITQPIAVAMPAIAPLPPKPVAAVKQPTKSEAPRLRDDGKPRPQVVSTSSTQTRVAEPPAEQQPAEPTRNGTKAIHLTGEALRLALIEDAAITRRANAAASGDQRR